MIDDAREALPPNAVREAIEADDVYALAGRESGRMHNVCPVNHMLSLTSNFCVFDSSAHVSKVGVGLLVRSEEDGLPPFSQAAVDNRVKVRRRIEDFMT